MKHSFKMFIGAVAVASMVAAAGTASAQESFEAKCHATIGKNIAKYQATLTKNLIGCHKARDKSGGAALCNTTLGADLKSKTGAARTKAVDAVNKVCLPGAQMDGGSDNVLALYPRCPSPVAESDDGGATFGIDTFTELTTCLLDLSEAYVNRVGEQVMGYPATVPILDKEVSKCHGAIGKGLSKVIKTAGKTYTKCQSDQEKLGNGLDYDASCLNAAGDTKQKVSATFTAFDAIFGASGACADTLISQAEWFDLGTCGTTGAAMQACASNRVVKPTSKGLAAAALELPGTCAAEADVIISSGFSGPPTVAGDPPVTTLYPKSNSRLDSGWKGSAHFVDVIDQSFGAVTLSGCDADCKDCAVVHNPKHGNCRCDSAFLGDTVNPTIECTTNNGPDVACGGGNCTCMFGPPLAISASSTPVCVVNRFTGDFTGGTSEVGEYDVGTSTRALVHLGVGGTQPCPICVGDTTPNDGVKNGTCEDGLRNNLSCDENADHPDFGPVSFDCPPSPGGNISGAGLLLDLQFSSGTQSLAAARTPGAQCLGADNCHCSVCSGNRQIGCVDDATCNAAGAGTCGAAPEDNPQQNDCDTVCTDDGDGNGLCDGPIDTFCDGFLRGNGNGIITCGTDLDCDANDCDGDNVLTPGSGECGACLHAGFRQCFLPTITATGTPGIYSSEGISVFCSGQTNNQGINTSGGLPGPGRVKIDFDFNLFCDDGITEFQPPAGSNCP